MYELQIRIDGRGNQWERHSDGYKSRGEAVDEALRERREDRTYRVIERS